MVKQGTYEGIWPGLACQTIAKVLESPVEYALGAATACCFRPAALPANEGLHRKSDLLSGVRSVHVPALSCVMVTRFCKGHAMCLERVVRHNGDCRSRYHRPAARLETDVPRTPNALVPSLRRHFAHRRSTYPCSKLFDGYQSL